MCKGNERCENDGTQEKICTAMGIDDENEANKEEDEEE